MARESHGPRRALPDTPCEEPTAIPRHAIADSPTTSPHREPSEPRRAAPSSTKPRTIKNVSVALVSGTIAICLVLAVGVLYVLYGSHGHGSTPDAATPPAARSFSPTPTEPPGTDEVVGDATVTVPHQWKLYHDELTEDDRRLIRVQDPQSNLRLQIATLTAIDGDLAAACQALVADQSQEYAVDFQILPRPAAVEGKAEAVICGFTGTRQDQQAPTSVRFTLIRRASDSHTLVVRAMQPETLPADAKSARQAATMTCQAADSFGHRLPLC